MNMEYIDRNGKKWSIEDGDWQSYQHDDVKSQKKKKKKKIFLFLIFLLSLTLIATISARLLG